MRTAIAVMAFGFLVEKFDLFLEIATPSFSGRTLSLSSQRYGKLAGLALIVLGSYDCRRRHPLQDDGEKH